MRYLAQFRKIGEASYISHLDLMRAVQRILRRADIPVRYSLGFNPHPVLAFAAASPVGVHSFAEYMDVALETEMDVTQVTARLAPAMGEALELSRAVCVPEEYPALMSRVHHADYVFVLYNEMQHQPLWQAFAAQPEILVQKKGKKGWREIDIRPMILSSDMDEEGALEVTLAAGSAANLSPQLLLRAYGEYVGEEMDAKMVLRQLWAGTTDAALDLLALV
jgi:radical SAM-linked protein